MPLLSKAKSAAARSRIVFSAVDVLIAAALRVAAPPFVFFARIGAGRLPRSTRYLKRRGVFAIRDHYYQPLFNDAHLTRPLAEARDLPGVDLRRTHQVEFLREIARPGELKSLALDRPPLHAHDFCVTNGSFEAGDAEVLYSVLRALKPRRVLEIGSGHSTKLANVALRKNAQETGLLAEHVCIEPYEMPWLEQLEGVTVLRERVENVDIALFQELDENDLLFIDSSHVIRPQGDVLYEYLQILPSLRPGVVVHVHDIFTPRDYPDKWVRDEVRMWNEQYLLEALLANNARYQVLAALNHLKHEEFDELSRVCPYLNEDREPGSFYLKVR